ncbi:MAG: YcaQ family DNA glycosylase [Anaerolineales bacterium]|nr:YcaQ family DNA glycosylase [Anaerolineales bacterium]
MAKHAAPPELTISKQQARRYLVGYHRLAPPRKLAGKAGALAYIRQVNCIQYDPINVVGQNPHLVLQSRVRNYKSRMLNELLYTDRQLVDGFDKVMSIYPTEDWPFFSGYRSRMGQRHLVAGSTQKAVKLLGWVREEVRTRGPISALELEDDTKMDWWLTNSARAVRIALDILFYSGELVVHHRVGTRRYFDLAERLLAKPLARAADPHGSLEAYRQWHVLRRVHSLGMARPIGNDHWGGVNRSGSLLPIFARLHEDGELARVRVAEWPQQDLYVPRAQLSLLQARARTARPQAAFIAPLDNFLWDRTLIEQLFDFYYRWEVYVPAPKREYGYYVLPVLYGDQLIARLDPGFERASKTFVIKNWWWQPGAPRKDEAVLAALAECVHQFAKYLGAEHVELGVNVRRDIALKQVLKQLRAKA